ncbi:AAA family ATPase [[Pseudomonas] boreopolis]|jgi:pilus assembly protein CpaE
MSKVTAMQQVRSAAGQAVRVLLYAPDNRYGARLAAKLAGFGDLQWEDSRDIAPAMLAAQQASWRLVLLDYSNTNANYSSELTVQLRSLMPALPVVAVGLANADHAPTVLAALRAGVSDFIDIESPAEEIQTTLKRVLAQPATARVPVAAEPAPVPQPKGRLVVLLGSRPGVGTTTLATQLSVLLQRPADAPGDNESAEARRLLLDLGIPSGDAALYLNTDVTFHYEDALRNLGRIDATLARTALAHHASGLALLGHPTGIQPPAHDPSMLLDRLRSVFGLVLCDLGGLAPQQLPSGLLHAAAETWLLTDQSIGALVSLDHLLKELEQRGLRNERLQLLVNRYDDSHGISAPQLAARFGLSLLATLPDRARALHACAAEGKLLSEQAPNDPYIRALAPLVRRLDPAAVPAQPVGLHQRLVRGLSGNLWKTK